MKIYYCYRITNITNGKAYIGFATNPQLRWREHKRVAKKGKGFALHAAIRKYGIEFFAFEVICCGKNRNEMLEIVEPQLIEQYQSKITQNGYNINRGGGGPTEETRQKMSQEKRGKPSWNKGRKHSKESIERMINAKIGKKATPKTRRKMSESRSAYLTPERRALQGRSMVGHKNLTVESKRKIGAATRKYSYQVTLPNGSQQIVTSLAQFCRDQNINEFTARVAAKQNRPTKTGYIFHEIEK